MTHQDTFREGFVQGWRAIKGGYVGVPSSTTYASSHGRTPFQEGIRRAVLKALQQQGKLAK